MALPISTNPNDTVTPINDNQIATFGFGLTKREYFSAMAMQGLMANSDTEVSTKTVLEVIGCELGTKYEYPKHWTQYLAVLSVTQADALISELNKGK